MITKTGIALAIITAITALLAIATRDLYFYIISSLGCSVVSVAFFISKSRLRNISVTRHLPKAATSGESIYVKIDVKNNSGFQEGPLKITDAAGHSIFIDELHKGIISYNYDVLCEKRGVYKIGPVILETADLLGIFNVKRQIDVYSELVVYPSTFSIKNLAISGGVPSFGGAASRISGDYEEFYGIREHKIDDGLKKIHWPSTARLGELMVKQYEQSTTYKTTVVLDSCQGQYASWKTENSFEWAVKIAASISRYLIDRKIEVQFVAEADISLISQFASGQTHLFEIMELLAKVKTTGEATLDKVLDAYEKIIPSGSSAIVIFSRNTPQIYETLARLRARRINVIPVIMSASDELSEELQDLYPGAFIVKESDVSDIESKFIL